MDYNAYIAPKPDLWLSLTDSEKAKSIIAYHDSLELENSISDIHVFLHGVIEDQLASGEEEVVNALNRLLGEGLDRHSCIHAICTVFCEGMYNLVNPKERKTGNSSKDWYDESLRKLNTDEYLRRLTAMENGKIS